MVLHLKSYKWYLFHFSFKNSNLFNQHKPNNNFYDFLNRKDNLNMKFALIIFKYMLRAQSNLIVSLAQSTQTEIDFNLS